MTILVGFAVVFLGTIFSILILQWALGRWTSKAAAKWSNEISKFAESAGQTSKLYSEMASQLTKLEVEKQLLIDRVKFLESSEEMARSLGAASIDLLNEIVRDGHASKAAVDRFQEETTEYANRFGHGVSLINREVH